MSADHLGGNGSAAYHNLLAKRIQGGQKCRAKVSFTSALVTVKIAVFAPIPRARVMTVAV
jgi:hypothetical protein